MATAGMTKEQAVSRMLMSTRSGKVTSLNPSGPDAGTDDTSDAEALLDDVTDEFIISGHPSTTRAGISHTASGGGVVSVADAKVLGVRGCLKHVNRKLTLRGQEVYDEAYGSTACFVSGETVFLDLFEKPSLTSPDNFELLDPSMKVLIRDEAVRRWRIYKAPDGFMDQALERIQMANLNSPMGAPDRRLMRPEATVPFAPSQRPQGRRGFDQ